MENKTTLPWWLQLALGVFSIISPQLFWLKFVVEAAYEIFKLIPWKKKARALVELRRAVCVSRKNSDVHYIVEWTENWKKSLGL